MAVDCQVNGDTSKYIETLDADDPEYLRQLMRPVEVKEDVRQMEERKRVKLVLESRLFRDELEDLVVEQMFQNGGPLSPSSITVQRLSDLLAPRVRSAAIGNGVGPCIPISDTKSSVVLDATERTFRCKLASLYRLVDLLGWTHGLQGGISGRISQEFERFLVSSHAILPHEVTTSNLVKVNSKGDILETPINPLTLSLMPSGSLTTQAGVDKNEFRLHSAVYACRPSARCLVHLANIGAVSISALHQGLLPLTKEAISLGDISYFAYGGGHLDLEQRDKLRRALAPTSKVLFLRNFGVMLIGDSVEEAFWLAKNVMGGINSQLSLVKSAGGLTSLKLPSEDERRAILQASNEADVVDESGWRYGRGEKDFEAMMRHLDNAGYRTGYPYRDGTAKTGGDAQQDGRKVKDRSVAEPPLASSFVLDFDSASKRTSSRFSKQPLRGAQSFGGKDKKEDSNNAAATDNSLDVSRDSKWSPENTSTPIKPAADRTSKQQKIGDNLEETVVASAPPKKPELEKKASEERAAAKSPPMVGSPTKSSSSTDKELSPTHGTVTSPTKEKKKKKGFFSSFNRKKDK